jgi:hypothetical protein
MRRKHQAAKRDNGRRRLREQAVPTVPTVRPTERSTPVPPTQPASPTDTEAEETVRRMVEAAYT